MYWKIWILSECLFFGYFLYTKTKLQKIGRPRKPLTDQERKILYYQCLDTIDDLHSWSQGWFYYKDRTHPTKVKRGNLAEWLAWAFWHDDLKPEYSKEIEWMISSAEKQFQTQFPKGHDPDLCCIRLDLDPVQALHRPLVVYLALYLCTLLSWIVLYRWGFQRTPGLINYWSRSSDTDKTPIVFIHGVGIGLLGYMDLIRRMADDRTVYLIELPYVSMRFNTLVPSAWETAREIHRMLDRSPAVFVSHSLGTGVFSWVSRFAPHLVAGSVLIDPICFLLHYPHVAFNFIHRLPTTLIEYVLYYCISRELYISHFVSRHLQWFETIHFGPLKNASVFISERDWVSSALSVRDYLEKLKVDVYWMTGLKHAGFLLDEQWKQRIMNEIERMSYKADQNVEIKKI